MCIWVRRSVRPVDPPGPYPAKLAASLRALFLRTNRAAFSQTVRLEIMHSNPGADYCYGPKM